MARKEVKFLIKDESAAILRILPSLPPLRGSCAIPELLHRIAAFRSVSVKLTTQAHNPINCHAASTERLRLIFTVL